MKYYIKTFGCQMNHSDSERMAGFLESYNYKKTDDINQADLVIFNTCGVRQSAENRVYGQIHNIKKKAKDKIIILTGCLANRKDVQKRLEKKVDLFCEIKDFPKKIAVSLKQTAKSKKKIKQLTAYCLPFNTFKSENSSYLSIPPRYSQKHTAYAPIMSGCNNFCAYCVVPYARGKEFSRPAEEIINEIRSLVKKGYKEIVLLGQNVNSYNYLPQKTKDATRKEINFPKLLRIIEKIPGHFWISFVSSHPKDYSDELIKTIAKSQKICEYVHLPLQAGDDEILARMNRKYTQKHYLNLVKKIKSTFKKHKPDTPYSITSDIIVGFPGETKKQFMESAKIMEKAKYDMVYFGQFSPRPGTAAWKLKDNVSKYEKERREKFLNEILKKTTSANNKKYVGKIIEVLIDKGNSVQNNTYFGRTRTMKNIKLVSKKPVKIGTLLKAKITKANIWNLEGEILK